MTLVALPVGLALLLALALLFLVGATWAVVLGGPCLGARPAVPLAGVRRGVGDRPRGQPRALLNLAAWALAGVFGTGAMPVASWRARGTGGRHRAT